ncbi:MAG: TlpA family protein disulfide reductase [Lachnospiraceae bacterium]|nr:TlpA family protein disulfide reductase [Lachnospiraceae bacterium]
MNKRFLMILMVAVLLVGCSSNRTQGNTSDVQQENVSSDNPATEEKEPYMVAFEANTIDGQAFSSDRFADSKITMINVWATYCNPCLAEMPDLGDIADNYNRANFQLVGIISDVTEDSPQDDIENAKELIRQTEADYPHLLLSQSIFDNLVGGVSSVPTTFFVNSKGEMLGYVVGANDEDTWEQIIDDLLQKEGVSVEEDEDGDD